MNEKELIGKVHSTVYHQSQRRGYAAPVDVLMEVGVLQKQKYEDWRFGRVDYLERVCTVNLRKLSFIMRQMQVCAQKSGLKSSFCYYKQWGVKKKNGQGHKPVVPLRFSKSGNPEIEKWYATYFVDTKRVAVLKAQQHIENPDFPKDSSHAAVLFFLGKEEPTMATKRIMPLHIGKGRTESQAVSDTICIENGLSIVENPKHHGKATTSGWAIRLSPPAGSGCG